jgi:uncharacterized protein (TIGR02145 family)
MKTKIYFFTFILALTSMILESCSTKKNETEPASTGTLSGTVKDNTTNAGLIATVTLDPGAITRTTANDGYFTFTGLDPAGTYSLIIKSTGYNDETRTNLKVTANQTTVADIAMTVTPPPTVTDYEGNIYKTIVIGTQTWMAENLRSSKFNDGTDIPQHVDNTLWSITTTSCFCWYNNNPGSYFYSYGALYNWYAVNSGKLGPAGWHVPTDADWQTLVDYLGGESVAGPKLREVGLTHWTVDNCATNETKFTALPGGFRDASGNFIFMGTRYYMWTTLEQDPNQAWSRFCDNGCNIPKGYYFKKCGFSVRCVKN